jgi:tetratricopeptide (TPR) repeat protein
MGGHGHHTSMGSIVRQSSRRRLRVAKSDVLALLTTGMAHHTAGRLDQAEAQYRQALQTHPSHPDALHLLGVVTYQRGNHAEAERLIRRAIAHHPQAAEYHSNLGNALRAMGRRTDAEQCYRRAVELNPSYADAWNNLGVLLKDQERYEEALDCYKQATCLNPRFATALTNLGTILQEQGRFEEAVGWHELALSIEPNNAGALTNLGVSYHECGDYAKAIQYHRRALALQPDLVDALVNLANALNRQDQPAEALELLRRALARAPDRAVIHNNLGAMLETQGDMDGALACYRKAHELDPELSSVYSNMGAAYKKTGRVLEALRCYNEALRRKPDYHTARFNRALALLYLGQLEEGWREYEAGFWSNIRKPQRPFSQPVWRGEELGGKTILVWGEQGVGDEMIFANTFPDLIAAARHVVVECEPRLVALFSRSFPGAEVLPRTDVPHPRALAPDIDVQTPAGNIPRWLRGSLDRFPNHSGYLKADPAAVERWRKRLDALGGGLKVGVSWRSMVMNATRALDYIQIEQAGPIFAVPGVQFVNLQYSDCRQELALARARFGVELKVWDDLDLKDDLDGVAALISALDLVVSVSTAVSVMAGALGKPVWQLTFVSSGDWQSLGTDYVPWFPSMKRFDRTYEQPWDAAIAAVAEQLRQVSSLRLPGLAGEANDSGRF